MKESSTPSDVADAVLAVWRVLRPRIDSVMSEHGLSMSRGKLLTALQREGPCRPGELAAQFGQSPRTLTDAIDGLERDGLVERQPHPTDRRAQLIVMTPAGASALAAVAEPRREAMDALFSCIDPDDRAALVAMLRTIERHGKTLNLGEAPKTP